MSISSNILNFPERGQHFDGRAENLRRIEETRQRMNDDWKNVKLVPQTTAPDSTLEKSLDEHRSTMLELAHRRQAFELQMLLETNTAQIKLEAAAYKALVLGVPESDIYALGEDMAEALSSAMNTVAGA